MKGGGAEVHVDTTGSITRLLKEACVTGKLEDVDRDVAPLRSENGIHDRNVLCCKICRDGQYEDAGDEVGLTGGVCCTTSGLYAGR